MFLKSNLLFLNLKQSPLSAVRSFFTNIVNIETEKNMKKSKKKFIYISLLLLLSQLSSSQIYYSHYLDDTSEWRYVWREYLPGGPCHCGLTITSYHTDYFDGTVNYNGYVYYKKYTASYRFAELSVSGATYIREDSNGKFYSLNDIVNGVEKEILDNNYIQSLQNGSLVPDTVGSSTTCAATVSTVMLDGLTLKKVKGLGYMIEGIGSSYGGNFCQGIIYECNYCPVDNHIKDYKVLYSYSKNGSIYINPDTVGYDSSLYPIPKKTSLSVSQFNAVKTKIFPNPTSKSVEIQCDSVISLIEIFDIEGRKIETIINDGLSITVDLTDYQSGVYLLKIKTDFGVRTEKIFKK